MGEGMVEPAWIEWPGGLTPYFVDGEVEARVRGGYIIGPATVDKLRWQHAGQDQRELDPSLDIVAYRSYPLEWYRAQIEWCRAHAAALKEPTP
jgi:hypothetical protein